MASALDDLVVLDFSESLAGQYCGRMFADYGASVILAEPEGGSAIRRMAPFSTTGESLQFFHLNTGKRCERLALDSAAGQAAMAAADVIILPESADATAVQARLQRAVVIQPALFGKDGPLAGWQGPEIVLQALSGMMHNNGLVGREPLFGTGNRAALACGIGAYLGGLVALFARSQGRAGQTVRINAAETAATMCFPYVMQYTYNGTDRQRTDQAVQAGQVLCRDGWVCIWIYNFRWLALLDTLGLPELAVDPRFAEPGPRRENWDALFAVFQEKVADLSAEDLVNDLQAAQVIAAKASRLTELRDNSHLTARGYWQEAAGRTILGPPFRLSKTPRVVREPRDVAFPPKAKLGRPAPVARSGRPLEGLRVIELTTAWAGPMSGRLLAFFGAEVIHVEAPNRVNSWRLNKDEPNPVNFPDGKPGARWFDRSFLFNSQNVNKLSSIINLKTDAGRELLRRMVAKSDVLICNFRPGTLHKLGLDYDSLRAIKPDIIVAELPAFGTDGPMAGHAALGPTMEMATGMSSLIGYPGGQPEVTGPSYMDPIGGFNAASAIMTALIHRARTGEGQYVEIPQVEAAMHLIGAELLHAIETGQEPARNGNRVPHAAPHDAFPARGEDQWVVIAALDDAQWQALCEVMGRSDLARDPRFAALPDRLDHQDALTTLLSDWTRGQDKHDLAERLQAAGVAAAPVNTPRDVANSQYLAHCGFFTVLDHPDAGRHPHPGLPIRLSATPGAQVTAAPRFGEHNRYILERILALKPEDIARVEASDAMADTPWAGG